MKLCLWQAEPASLVTRQTDVIRTPVTQTGVTQMVACLGHVCLTVAHQFDALRMDVCQLHVFLKVAQAWVHVHLQDAQVLLFLWSAR